MPAVSATPTAPTEDAAIAATASICHVERIAMIVGHSAIIAWTHARNAASLSARNAASSTREYAVTA